MDRRRESSIRRREAAAGPADETAEQQLERMHQELEQEVVDRPASGGLAAAEFLSVGAGSVVEEERGGESPRAADTTADDLRGSGETVGVRRVTAPDSTAGSSGHGGEGSQNRVAEPPRSLAPAVPSTAAGVPPTVSGENLVVEVVREPVGLEVGPRVFPQQSASDQGRVAQMVGHDGRDVPSQSANPMLDYPPGLEGQASSRDLMVLGNAQQTVQWGDRTVPVAVNPFWSPERKAYERMEVEWQRHMMLQDGSMGYGQVQTVERPSHLELQPPQQGFQGNRPQGSNPETRQKGVEMDPIELFRLRCLREARKVQGWC